MILQYSPRNHSPVKEPRSRVIRGETDGHVVSSAAAYGHHIAADRIHEISGIATRNPHNIKIMLRKHLVRDKRGEVDRIRRANV